MPNSRIIFKRMNHTEKNSGGSAADFTAYECIILRQPAFFSAKTGDAMGIPVKLEAFEGPLDLAATLLDIKCRMLLPKEVTEDGEEEDPRQELVEQLLQYKMYKYMAEELKERQTDSDMVLYRSPDVPEEVMEYVEPVDLDKLLDGLSLSRLSAVFREVMKRQNDKIDPVRSRFGKIEKEEVSLSERLDYIHDYLRNHRVFSFRQMLENQKSRMQIVVTFLAVLEMMKLGEIHVEQEETFGEIMIERTEDRNGN